MEKDNKILVIRSDKLGDVLLSLPSLYALRANLDNEIHFLARKSNLVAIDELLSQWNIKKIEFENHENLDFNNYYAVIFLFSPLSLLFRAWIKRVPLRIGIFSKPFSFLLLTHGLIQHRSRAKKKEAIYNMELAEKLLSIIKPSYLPSVKKITIRENPKAKEEAIRILEALGIRQKFIICHPGSGGSSSLIPSEKFIDIIISIEKTFSIPVLLSIGPSIIDKKHKILISEKLPNIKIIEDINIKILMEIYRLSKLVIAPATGPLHLAHYVGTRTIGLFSPIKNEKPSRWEPFGGSGISDVIYPEIDCPSKRKCIGNSCKYFYCMEKVNWNDLVISKAVKYGL